MKFVDVGDDGVGQVVDEVEREPLKPASSTLVCSPLEQLPWTVTMKSVYASIEKLNPASLPLEKKD